VHLCQLTLCLQNYGFLRKNQPLTHVIQAIRVWLVDTPVGNSHELAFVRSASLFDMIGYLTRVINQCSDNSRGVSSLYMRLAFDYSEIFSILGAAIILLRRGIGYLRPDSPLL
jgi:hypothetical protein